MSDNYDLISDPNNPKRKKWEARTIHATGELAGNPRDPRRARSQFEIALYVKDPCFVDKCFLMVEYDPYTYEDACEDPIWKKTTKDEFHSLQKNDT